MQTVFLQDNRIKVVEPTLPHNSYINNFENNPYIIDTLSKDRKFWVLLCDLSRQSIKSLLEMKMESWLSDPNEAYHRLISRIEQAKESSVMRYFQPIVENRHILQRIPLKRESVRKGMNMRPDMKILYTTMSRDAYK